MKITVDIPVIETEDLILRGYDEADFEAFAAFGTSDRAAYVGGPHTRWDSWRAFMAGIGHWALRGYGMWMIEHRATGSVAGRVGMILNDGWDEPELGWHIYDGFEGKGYAYQAALAARDHAARHFGLDGVISYIDATNTRSLRLADRLGAKHERDGTVVGTPCQVWRHPRVARSASQPAEA
ncbi:acetyltransferase [Roseovarius atlanticus]|uniref:Acetyltransferase n=1 Tax=Roseovarius atlanticus TaxID=1641875 RepID=A0A0T5NYE2_9RHOB|nr:GNAT family N-acetyltransferase [Roseovarius atlanticus]KRS13814.1 acetyltransferase [Roseovarius atlanticus]